MVHKNKRIKILSYNLIGRSDFVTEEIWLVMKALFCGQAETEVKGCFGAG